MKPTVSQLAIVLTIFLGVSLASVIRNQKAPQYLSNLLLTYDEIPLSNAEKEWLASLSPSKRCAMLGDEACANGGIPGAASDNDWLVGGFNPGKRCAPGDEACATGNMNHIY